MFTLRADIDVTDGLHVGLQGKKVDDRFGTDLNNEISPGYTVFDLDADATASRSRASSRAEIQFNVTNLLDEEYYGNISSGTGRRDLGRLLLDRCAAHRSWASVRFNF